MEGNAEVLNSVSNILTLISISMNKISSQAKCRNVNLRLFLEPPSAEGRMCLKCQPSAEAEASVDP